MYARPARTAGGPERSADPGRKVVVAALAGATVRLQDSKGLCYLAELVAQPGTEHVALHDSTGNAEP